MKKLIVLISLQFLFSQVPHKMSFQAYLTDANNMPVAPGSYEMTFRMFDAYRGKYDMGRNPNCYG